MLWLSGLAVAIHVFTVFWLVAGVIGRDVVHRQARGATDLAKLRAHLELGSRFELGMVRPATGAVLVAGVIAAWARGWPILGFLQGASVNWVLTSIAIYLTIIPVIALVFVPRGKEFRAALEEATAQNQITPRLTTALNDPAVAGARRYELVMIAVITYLMVTRPF